MDDPRIDPADLRSARFPGSSRRYEAKAVDQFLRMIVERVEATNAFVDDLLRRVADAEAAAAAEPVPADRPELSTMDDDELVGLVGQETASVLSTARRAAEDIRSKAEESAARVIREATDEAKRVLDEARDRVVELTSDAESAHERAVSAATAEAERIRQDAERDAHRVLAEAREEASALVEAVEVERAEAQEEAARVLVEAREEGRSMVAEAKEVRTRILEDLQRRRDIARTRIERLHSGREELVALYARIREQVEEITGELTDGELPDDADHDHPALPDLPDLPDGFVGIVGGEPDTVEATAPDAGEAAPDDDAPDDDGPGEGPDDVDDTVAPAVEAAPEPAAEPDSAVEREPDVESGSEPDVEPESDVDALFARLRAEREASVARAHELLDEPPAPEPPAAEAGDAAETGEGVDDVDPDRVPEEFLAPADRLEARADVVDALDTALARRLKRQLADEQNAVLDLLRRTGATSVDDLLPEAGAHLASYSGAALVDLAGAATAGAASVDRSASPPEVTALAEALGSTIVEPFRRRLERACAEVGGDADELDERLRALYREWKVQHIAPAVHDALLSAYALGTHEAAPDDVSLRWLIDPEQGPCPDAQDNALAGAVRKGDTFPTGDACPQAHPGCRCLLVVDRG